MFLAVSVPEAKIISRTWVWKFLLFVLLLFLPVDWEQVLAQEGEIGSLPLTSSPTPAHTYAHAHVLMIIFTMKEEKRSLGHMIVALAT